MLGVNIEDQLKFDNYDVSKVSTKVSQQIAVRYWIVLCCIYSTARIYNAGCEVLPVKEPLVMIMISLTNIRRKSKKAQ